MSKSQESDYQSNFTENGGFPRRNSSIDDGEADYERRQRVLRITIMVVVGVCALLLFLLVYVFNKSSERSGMIASLIIFVAIVCAILWFALLGVRNLVLHLHEVDRGKAISKHVPEVRADRLVEEYSSQNEKETPPPEE